MSSRYCCHVYRPKHACTFCLWLFVSDMKLWTSPCSYLFTLISYHSLQIYVFTFVQPCRFYVLISVLSSEVSGRCIDVCRSPADWAGSKRQCLWSRRCEGNRTAVEEPLLPHLEGAEAQQLWHGSWWWKGKGVQENRFSVNKAEQHMLNENCCLDCVDPSWSADGVPWTIYGNWNTTQAKSVCCRKEPFGKWRRPCSRQGLSSKDFSSNVVLCPLTDLEIIPCMFWLYW